jgi:hypothetical protein
VRREDVVADLLVRLRLDARGEFAGWATISRASLIPAIATRKS